VQRSGLVVIERASERAGGSPARFRNDATLGFLLREAIKLARGRRDPTLVWLLHKCVERMTAEFHPQTLDKSGQVKHTERVDDSREA